MSSSHRHSRVEANNVDPDDGRSLLCSACNLPIFATPFVGGGGGGGGATPSVLHDECYDLPEELKHSELHREKPMFLVDNELQSATCSQCSQKCGSKMYHCPDPDCGLILDAACALPIKILHWSHPHRLQPIRGCNLSTCRICGAAHELAGAEAEAEATSTTTSYLCSACGFWIHPECAALARVIEHEKHEHPLVLYYDIQATFGAEDSTPLTLNRQTVAYVGGSSMRPLKDERCLCGICRNEVPRRCAIYSCIMCRDYVIHVNCATSHPHTFKSVSIGEARFPNLVRLPMKDEHQSFVRYARSQVKDPMNLYAAIVVHMLIVHGDYSGRGGDELTRPDNVDDQDPSRVRVRVCDVCNKIVKTPDDQFYGCPLCSNFFVHDYCNTSLPTLLSTISAHTRDHKFLLTSWPGHPSFVCSHCRCEFIGPYYKCVHQQCREERFCLDASCALLPGFITHGTHNAAHFMRLTTSSSSRDRAVCDCCCRPLGSLFYECRTCPNFALHTWCAMLPKTVTHKFDKHPLILTATTASAAPAAEMMMMICEICENGMESDEAWYYSCSECDQSFHVDCIPCLDLSCKFKSVADSDPRVRLPTRLIRGLTLRGHGHDYCADVVADEYDILLPYS